MPLVGLLVLLTACAHVPPSSPPGASRLTTVTLRLSPHDDLKQSLEAFVRRHQIDAACVVTCVASLEQAALRFANQRDATTLTNKFEVTSLVGTLSQNGSHLHIQLADGEGRSVGGHVMEGCRIYTTAEVVLGILSDVAYARILDPTYGYKELVVQPKTASTPRR